MQHTFTTSVGIDEKTRVINCLDCGFYHVFPYPDANFLDHFYSYEYKDDLAKIHLYERAMRIKEKCGRGDVLDIGCGNGDFIDALFECDMVGFGIEPSISSYLKCKEKGLIVVDGFTEKNTFGRKFDIINLSFVLEHVPSPAEFLKNLKDNFLKEGGYICIEVPNDFNLLQRVYKEYYGKKEYWIAFPDHLNYWSFTTFEWFLKRSGLAMVYKTSSFPVELFLLMDEDYINFKELGKIIHEKRLIFENKFLKTGHGKDLFDVYSRLLDLDVGRTIDVITKVKG